MKRRQLSTKIKHFIKQPAFYIAVLIVGISSGCFDRRQRAAIAPQQPGTQTAAPNNLNFIANVVQEMVQLKLLQSSQNNYPLLHLIEVVKITSSLL